jgi:hypothetical protein
MASSGSKGAGQSGSGAKQAASSDTDGLKSFLVGLATDPARLGAFIKDPDAELEAAGVDEANRAILKSGNPAAIYGLISGQQSAQQPPIIVLIIDAAEGDGDAAQLNVRGQAGAQAMYPMIMPPPMVWQSAQQMFPMIMPSGPQSPALAQLSPHITLPIHPPPVIHWPIHWPIIHWPIHPNLIATNLLQTPIQVPQMIDPGRAPTAATASAPAQFPQFIPPQIHPQVVFPQIHPQLVVQPQIHPQMVFPQIHPQLVVQPQIHPQLVFQQIHPQIVAPQIFPQIFPQIYPMVFGWH